MASKSFDEKYKKRREGKSFSRYTLDQRTQKMIENVVPFVSKQSGETLILDIGCADGAMTKKLCASFPSAAVVGIESNTKFTYQPSLTNERYAYANILQLPIAPNSIDIVVASAVFKHLRDPKLVIANISTALKSGGVFVVSDPRPFMVHLGKFTGKFDKRWLHNIWSLKKYREFFSTYGLDQVAASYYMPPIGLSNNIEKMLHIWPLNSIFLHQIAVFKKRAP